VESVVKEAVEGRDAGKRVVEHIMGERHFWSMIVVVRWWVLGCCVLKGVGFVDLLAFPQGFYTSATPSP
jgi:hypothetical protein